MIIDDFMHSEGQIHELISEIWKMKESFTSYIFDHIGRDDNCLADKFVKFGFYLNLDCMFCQSLHSFASALPKEVFMNHTMLNSI